MDFWILWVCELELHTTQWGSNQSWSFRSCGQKSFELLFPSPISEVALLSEQKQTHKRVQIKFVTSWPRWLSHRDPGGQIWTVSRLWELSASGEVTDRSMWANRNPEWIKEHNQMVGKIMSCSDEFKFLWVYVCTSAHLYVEESLKKPSKSENPHKICCKNHQKTKTRKEYRKWKESV